MKILAYAKTVPLWTWMLVGILSVAAALRFIGLEAWMHYELDQARDFRIVHAAVEHGPGELPLQGPRAAGTFLRLGPLLYYIEYLSALIFGDSPVGSIVIIAALNVLTVFLVYLVMRFFFVRFVALWLTAISAVSLFLVTYSRFGWNPTLIPFFSMLLLYALLQLTRATEKRKGLWLALAACALGGAMQMHFLAFVTLPVVVAVFLLYARPVVSFGGWFAAIIMMIFLQTPLIVNDVLTGGENFQELWSAVVERGTEESSHTLLDNASRMFSLQAQYLWLTATGDQYAEFPVLRGADIMCDYDCRYALERAVPAALLFIAGVGFLLFAWRHADSTLRKRYGLIIIWALVVCTAYVPLAEDVAPRFFLLCVPFYLVMIGLVLRSLLGWRRGRALVNIFGSMLLIGNVYFVVQDFSERARAQHDENFVMHPDRVLKEKTRVTLSQMEQIVDVMHLAHKETGLPIMFFAQAEYKRAFWERLDYRDIPRRGIAKDLTPLYRDALYYIVVRTQSDQEAYLAKFLVGLEVVEINAFGTLTLYRLAPKEVHITDTTAVITPPSRDPKFAPGVQVRYLWRQVLPAWQAQRTD